MKNEKRDDGKADLPAAELSPIEALRFCNWLSVQMELDPVYTCDPMTIQDNHGIYKPQPAETWSTRLSANGFRLPTSDQFRVAALTGRSEPPFGPNPTRPILLACVRYASDSTIHGPWRPGSGYPNDWGFWDLIGNVSEWIWDSNRGKRTSALGGSYNCSEADVNGIHIERLEHRSYQPFTGFRVVLECR